MQLTQRRLLHLENLSDHSLFVDVLRLGLEVLDHQRDLHDVVDGRDQHVRQLELLAPRVTIAPLLTEKMRR